MLHRGTVTVLFALAFFAVVLLTIEALPDRESLALTLDPVPVLGNSGMWSTTIPTELGLYLTRSTQYGQRERVKIVNPYVAVTYRARIVNTQTGEIVPPSGSVLEGTPLHLEFEPHYSQDVYWTTTGYAWDTPYGDWSANAGAPPISCEEKDLVGTKNTTEWGPYPYDLYVALMADPPEKTLSGTSGLTCASPDASGNVSCTASQAGQVNPMFSFEPTIGKFYGRVDMSSFGGPSCFGTNYPFGAGEKPYEDPYYSISGPITPELLYQFNDYFIEPYTLSVGQVDIPYPITITDADGDPPGNPSLNTVGGACTVGSPYSLTMTATDPDGDTIKYAIDWDANGTVDQFAPSSGYVPSGTSQTVSRTYATEGSKTVKVMAIDENGLTSSWSTLTFSCTDEGSEATDTGEDLGGGDEGTGGGESGATPNLTIRAIPSLVRTGETTKLHWSASNVTSCTVQGDNGDSFSGTISPEPQGQASSPINEQTTYTLSCTDEDDNTLTQSTTVNILPVWSEF